jgi:hypothetical protein
MEQPKVEDVMSYLSKLRSQGIKPKHLEILYPTLAEALKKTAFPHFTRTSRLSGMVLGIASLRIYCWGTSTVPFFYKPYPY